LAAFRPPGEPEQYPDKVVHNREQERAACALGWSSPSPCPDEPAPAQVGIDAIEYEQFLAWKRSQAQPRRTKMSGYQRRKLAKERAAHVDLAGVP
jgi:hypothetical protein